MELLYLYIEDDGKKIKDCEFNFSPQYKFHYRKDKKFLEFKEIEDYIPNFWNVENISNITAIIGKNGSGKSNLIEFIIRFCASSNGIKEFNQGIILVYKKNNLLLINRNDIKSNHQFNQKHYVQYPFNPYNGNYADRIIYFSPHTEKYVLKELGKGLSVDDISNSGILRSDAFRRGDRKYVFTDLEYLQMLNKLATLNYEAETLGIDKLTGELKSPAYSEKISMLNLKRYVVRMSDSNEAFKTLFSGRMVPTP